MKKALHLIQDSRIRISSPKGLRTLPQLPDTSPSALLHACGRAIEKVEANGSIVGRKRSE